MKITEEGRARVASLELAEEMRSFVRDWRAAKKPEELCQRMIITRVALALASLEYGPVPEPSEFTRFIDDNHTEINAAIGECLKTLMRSDLDKAGASVH